jgi:hypothetical protein
MSLWQTLNVKDAQPRALENIPFSTIEDEESCTIEALELIPQHRLCSSTRSNYLQPVCFALDLLSSSISSLEQRTASASRLEQ